jgi:hypothetical protein
MRLAAHLGPLADPDGRFGLRRRMRLDLAEGSSTNPTYHTVDLKFIK